MKPAVIKAYDFAYRTGEKLPSDGLVGDPKLRQRKHRKQAKNNGPKTPHTVIGQVIVAPNSHSD